MKRKMTLLLLCVALLVSAMAFTVSAETLTSEDGNWEYTVNSGVATVTKYLGSDGEVTIPTEFGYYQVTAIGSKAFKDNATLTKINFPKALTSIGSYAFEGCVGLTSVTLPAKLTTLGARAFQNCTRLTEIIVQCTNLSDIKVEYSAYGQPFYGCGTAGDGITVTFADGCTRVPANMFYAYSGASAAPNVTSVVLADSVKEIGGYAFMGCIYLEKVDCGNGLTTISNSAFEDCEKLTDIKFSSVLNLIDKHAFNGCVALPEINLPDSLLNIYKCAFKGCVSLKEVTLPEKLSYLGVRSFENCTKLEKITVNCTTLGDIKVEYSDYGQPFYGCGTAGDGITVIFADGCTRVPGNMFYAYNGVAVAPNVTSVVISDSVTEVGANAFRNCVYLTDLDCGNGLTKIGDTAFNACNQLKNITWAPTLQTIGEWAFEGCTALTKLHLPEGITHLYKGAFEDCVALNDVVLPSSLTHIYKWAFYGCTNLTTITLPEKLSWLGARAFEGCTKLEEVIVDSVSLGDIKVEYPDYGQPFYGAGTATDGITVTFAEGCTRVPARMFYAYSGSAYAPNITSVEIADTVTEIGGYAFMGCAYLEKLDCGNGVTTISGSAFEDCVKLTDVTLSNSLTLIDSHAFNGCSALAEIQLPDSLVNIYKGAFKGCVSLTGVTLPKNLAYLGVRSFENCTKLEEIVVESVNLGNIKVEYSDYGQPFYGAGTATDGIAVTFAEGCTRVPASIFYAYSGNAYAPNITSVTVGSTVTEIGKNAFNGCAYLTEITFKCEVPTIGDNIFTGVVATAYHPNWPAEAQQNYGGTITWVSSKACEHEYEKSVVEPTCTEAGYTIYTCKCGDSYTEEIPAAGHVYEDGKCSICGEPEPATVYNHSGDLNQTKPTKEEILAMWEKVTSTETVFAEKPSVTDPYSLGKLSDSMLQSGLTYLNYVRYVATLPLVQLNDELNESAQYGAVVLAANNVMSHYPTQPAGMDEEFYKKGYAATSSSNLSMNYGYKPEVSLQVSVRGCMADSSSPSNLACVGHRRWLLNPTLLNVGFGYAQSTAGSNYSVTKVFDRSGAAVNFDFISWPASGNFPTNLFANTTPWSITLNPAKYMTPDVTKVQITITRDADGKTWTFNGSTGSSVSTANPYMLVETSGYGINNCIIFHPGSNNIDSYDGVFTVEVTGIQDQSGAAASLTYQIDFFDLDSLGEEEHKHEYTAKVTEPTCTEGGYTTHTCECGDSYKSDETKALGHDWDEGKVTKEATEDAEGEKTYTCKRCPETKTEAIPKLDHVHVYTDKVVEPTCTEGGYTTHTCKCGETYTDNETKALGHDWDEGKVTKEATEDAEGEKTYTCKRCPETKTESIPKLDHVHVYTDKVTEPTCTEGGYTTHTCKCGDSYKSDETKALGHDWDEGKVTKEATEDAEGEKTYTCKRCPETKTEAIPKLDHVHVYTDKVVEPTCTEGGYTTHTCKCGDTYTDNETKALGHDWDEGKVTKEATEDAEGEKTYTCKRCPETKTEAIPKLDHVHSYTAEVIEPTCKDPGYTVYTCSCGDGYKDDMTDALGHDWDEGKVTKEATEDEAGEKLYTCKRCPETKTEVIPTLDHVHSYTSEVTEPTCTEGGYTTHTCKCGDTYTDSETKALGHKYEGGTCTVCHEKDPDYVEPKPEEPDVPDVDAEIIRLAGANRFETAFSVAKQLKKTLGVEKFDTIILAYGADFADALSGSYLAAVKNAPILLAFNDKYNNLAIEYIQENLAEGGTVYILGGTKVIPEKVAETLQSGGITVKRLAGSNRFLTNIEILKEAGVSNGSEILVCSSTAYADALSASAVGKPILLIYNGSDKLFDAQVEYLNTLSGCTFTIIGGESAVGEKIADAISVYGEVVRLAGANRMQTSVEVAKRYFPKAEAAVVAYGWNYPDGLCGGSLGYAAGAPLILTLAGYESSAAEYVGGKAMETGYILGSKDLIPDASVNLIFGIEEEKEPEVDTTDTDGDGLLDSEEDALGTDKTKPDTDGDGFNDFAEVFLMDTDPLVANSLDADTDGDGLTDGDEVNKYSTDINAVDTDGDGLSDYDEVHTYGTDPVKEDTDGDSLSDSFELEHGLDPTKKSSDGTTSDAAVPVEQKLDDSGISLILREESNVATPSLSGSASGEMADNVFLASSVDAAFEGTRSVVGIPTVVDAEDSYVDGLTLEFDVSAYDGSLDQLVICTLNEDGTFNLVDSTVTSGTTLSCELTGSGTYFVMNAAEFLKSLGIDVTAADTEKEGEAEAGESAAEPAAESAAEASMSEPRSNEIPDGVNVTSYSQVDLEAIEALTRSNVAAMSSDVKGQADIVFVIDTTGSMYDAIDNVIRNVAAFANALAENYNVQINYGLIDFKDLEEDGPGTTIVVKNGHSNWYSSTADFVSKVRELRVNGGGDYEECDVDALETARRLDWRDSANKFIILITDADYKVANDYGISSMDEEVELLKKDGINVSVVTTNGERYRYESLYTTTGGIFANIYDDFSSVLMSLADLIGEETSDGSWVILKHGYRYVKLPAMPEAGSTTDTDGDGISDWDELGSAQTIDLSAWVKFQLYLKGIPEEEYKGATSVTVYNAKSDPTTDDTDGDGIKDGEDTAPWAKGLKGGIVGAIKICSYGTGPSSSGNFSGHAFVAYTSFVDEELELYGIKVDSYSDVAKEDDTREDRPTYHTVQMESNSVITIGGWAGWLPDDLKGCWINNELMHYNASGVPADQRSLTEYITATQLQKMCSMSYSCSEWTALYNCSAFATDVWNGVTGDDLSARGMLVFRNPASLSNNIEKRSGYEVGDALLAEWP